MSSHLVKVEGAGNDFLLGTGIWAQRFSDDPALAVDLCHRRRGLGADGVLAVFQEGPDRIHLVHRNADGSPSAFCANGTRCAARAAVVLLGLPRELSVATGWVDVPAVVLETGVSLELPPTKAPVDLVLETDHGRRPGTRLTVGVPHFVTSVGDLDSPVIEASGPLLRRHPGLGSEGANVHFIQIRDDGSLGIRSFERGVETEVLCCGSGVVAAALVHFTQTQERTLAVVPRSGDRLMVDSLGPAPGSPTRLTGPARLVAEIELLDD